MTFLLVAVLVFFGFFMLGGAAMAMAAIQCYEPSEKPAKTSRFMGPDSVVGPKHRH
jgi:hypothetical protein